MKRPSFQFYPADWRHNAKLRRCSIAARGAWMDVLCVLHDSDEYGVARWPLADVARAAGVPLKTLRELAEKDVLKGGDAAAENYVYTPRHANRDGPPVILVIPGPGPCWYCSRLVRDEYVRQRRGKSTRFSDENQPPKPTFGEAGGNEADAKYFISICDKKSNGATRQKEGESLGNSHECWETASPKPPFGEQLGDGSTSTSTSTSKSTTPLPPDGGNTLANEKPKKDGAIALQTFLDNCTAKGERPLRDYAPLWTYVSSAGLDPDYVALAWVEFCRRFRPGGTDEARRYKDWRCAFRNHVEKGWLKLWAVDRDGRYFLTSLGKQVQKVHEHKEAA